MWSKTFEARLADWNKLRSQAQTLDIPSALELINSWWQLAPWQPYYLHWDDLPKWPDPWQLLDDNVYCDVARGLGMLYTISLLERNDMINAELIETKDNYNLVVLDQGKYVLNTPDGIMLNTNLTGNIKRSLKQQTVVSKYQ